MAPVFRFDVIYHGRGGVNAFDGGKGRLHSRMTSVALKRAQKRSFFAADICAGAGVGVNFVIKSGPENVFAEQTRVTSFFEGDIHYVDEVLVLATSVDISGRRA